MPCRLLFDENLPSIARLLRDRGHDAATVRELGLSRQPDSVVLEIATSQQRIMVTADIADYLLLDAEWSAQNREHAGIILLAQRTWDFDIGWILRRLENFLEQVNFRLPGIVVWLPHITL